ncbi:hypothetical protein LTR27_009412 [Elasticomyces elasticus]|nr:hypothetical protein LTR27_009412 [Elasticomyces elasticus]
MQSHGGEICLLMVGPSSSTYRLGQAVIKVPRTTDEAELTQENAKAAAIEANVYSILSNHQRIANCYYTSPTKNLISNGNLKNYVENHGLTDLLKWSKQMIEAVEYVHSKGVRHSDLRLEQWFLDSGMNARLSDFNASGYDAYPALDLPAESAVGLETASHFLPRNPDGDSTVRSDLFALGSALYELENGSSPFAGADEETITDRFARGEFPPISDLTLGRLVSGAWKSEFQSATAILESFDSEFPDSCNVSCDDPGSFRPENSSISGFWSSIFIDAGWTLLDHSGASSIACAFLFVAAICYRSVVKH